MSSEDTITALATAAGESAIAMIRVSGPMCLQITKEALGNDKPQARSASLGYYRGLDGEKIDQLIYIYYEDGASYSGQAMLEFCYHGNPLISNKILDDLVARGCRIAEPGEFTRLAFMNGKLDLSQAEAVVDIIRARSDKALNAAQAQLAGALGKRISEYSEILLSIMAELEAYIDFPEEDIPNENYDGPLMKLKQLTTDIGHLKDSSRYSEMLHQGIKTAIVGEPNAGKSSLLNALLGDDRAIVSSEPGTTRDFITEQIMLGSYCLQIMDTAGLREPESEVERIGVEKTKEKIQQAEFLIFVLDAADELPVLDDDIAEALKDKNLLIIDNKQDIESSKDSSTFLAPHPHVKLSVKTGEGFQEFKDKLVELIEEKLEIPDNSELIISARHAEALSHVLTALNKALEMLSSNQATELAAAELRDALDAFGNILGKIDNESMLDALFSNFCIGK